MDGTGFRLYDFFQKFCCFSCTILLTKTTATQNEVAPSYGRVRGLYFLAVILATTISYSIYIYMFGTNMVF